ncbi:MAG: preprotein translocase subunit SecE [Planctomycetota bacterium]|nr:preprotein translocase subunit SecE [Patescibacteria group bacterium]
MAKVQAKKGYAIKSYLESSYQELRKVAWPTRNQAIRITFLVLGFVIVIAFAIGVLDYVFGFGHKALLDLGPARSAPVYYEENAPIENTVNVTDVTAETADGGEISVETVPLDSGEDGSSN